MTNSGPVCGCRKEAVVAQRTGFPGLWFHNLGVGEGLPWLDRNKVEQFLFQRAERNLNFDQYKIVFYFQIHKGIPIIEHNKMKPKKFSTQGWFNQPISISPYVIYDEV